MYDVLGKELNEDQFMTFSSDVLTSDESHRWGISPFHYCERYYREALAQIITKQLLIKGGISNSNRKSCIHSPLISFGLKLDVSAHMSGDDIVARCSLFMKNQECDGAYFAFYLMLDGVRQGMRWYDISNCAVFPIPEGGGKLEVIAFYKDALGEMITAKASVTGSRSKGSAEPNAEPPAA